MPTAEEKELLEAERKQRVDDLLMMRKLDKRLGVQKNIMTNFVLECNLRVLQYVHQFKAFGLMFLVAQTLQDFKRDMIVLQPKTIDMEKAVAVLRDEDHTKLYVNSKITRQALEAGGVFLFITEEEKKAG